jgi:hypothetical protein
MNDESKDEKEKMEKLRIEFESLEMEKGWSSNKFRLCNR